jgi:uncharacterized protein
MNALAVPVNTPHWRRRAGAVARWLHIYISMFSCALVLFFALTGITLNHAEWFGQSARQSQIKGRIEPAWVKADDAPIAKLEIVEHLRGAHGVKGAMSDFRTDDDQCVVSFKGPGYTADAFITRATGEYELTEMRMGLVAIMNDLHKGRDTGRAWSWFIDISSVLLALVSLTGLLLIAWIKPHRFNGYLVAIAGTAVVCLIYLLAVP